MCFSHLLQYCYLPLVKQVLAVQTSAINQLKHATDTGMCIACTDRLIHRKCICRCHAFIPWDWRVFVFYFVFNWSFFSISKISDSWIFITNIKNAHLLFSVKRWQEATRKIVPYPFVRYQPAHQNGYSCLSLTQMHPRRWYLFVLRFYGPVNPMGSCRARSVYLTTRLLGRLCPLSG